MAALFGFQAILSRLRQGHAGVRSLMDNSPLLIMRGETILDDNLRHAKMTRADLYAKLREANVLRLDEVRVAVLEQTGDVSVLHGKREVEVCLLEGVRDRP
ncbi:YetF domain-containing protein [Sulfitobacter alexandrii]|uniref:YetF domain-containing protein n=1 Tax=Sulfitobacter alexandrii TaxID=1917485 RepID=UPI0015612ACA|nr:YetF domain-containing protein [Sulfitobacter alexandrii]